VKVFRQYGSTALLSVVLRDAAPIIWVADAEAIKVIISDKHVFQKEVEAVRLFSFYFLLQRRRRCWLTNFVSMRSLTSPRRI
jgi:hypothetical protein